MWDLICIQLHELNNNKKVEECDANEDKTKQPTRKKKPDTKTRKIW